MSGLMIALLAAAGLGLAGPAAAQLQLAGAAKDACAGNAMVRFGKS